MVPVIVKAYFPNDVMNTWTSADDPLQPQRPFQALQCLAPQPPVATLAGERRVGGCLPLAPDPQDARVNQIDPAPPVQHIQAFYDVVGFAWPCGPALVRRVAGAVPPCDQG